MVCLRGVADVTRADVVELLALAASIPIRTTVETHPLEAVGEALRRLSDGAVRGAAVIDLGSTGRAPMWPAASAGVSPIRRVRDLRTGAT